MTDTALAEGVISRQIDKAWVECPRCGKSQRVEWYRKPNWMPPKFVRCIRCQERVPWDEMHFERSW